jgi:hypothetical protein
MTSIQGRYKLMEWKEQDTVDIHINNDDWPNLSKIKIETKNKKFVIRVDEPILKINGDSYIKIENLGHLK